jgi:hypothetical protein
MALAGKQKLTFIKNVENGELATKLANDYGIGIE